MNDDTAVIEPVRDDGLAAELAKAAPRRWWNRGTVVLGALLLLVGGFVTGLQVQSRWGTTDAPAVRGGGFGGGQNRAAYGGGFPQGAPQGGAPQGGPAASTPTAAGATTGKVKLVNGTTIYVETADGSVVTVKTDGGTTVATAGKLADVKAGQSITVQGSAAADGTVTATAVTARKG
ncbi:hypothetical protein [Actinoplanes solisilvae]|uniref:hypothetical protein n=1 Tax=Actinoplanes solisilvae TaxID=2486853 RepID=UPI001F0BA54E|nr:hypothetical protein [Actinoplanes solisilvae]